ncbi:ClpXP adapter SpxH family protein [Bacillus sp. FJAT-44742]|uniref:ClpXP adapter SpxH family protein n=1 Tax=Bacillus sp. FJAT-44742 TaxID=2014005 RepID=UPI000C2496F1|nr:ClpXP adapter SpxH family protein [Bacillus sp. FJAT-44742]
MKKEEKQVQCDDWLGICGISAEEAEALRTPKKKIELYVFTDPLCPECWAFEPTLKKFIIEFGSYFSIRFFIASQLESRDSYDSKHKKNPKNLALRFEETAARTGMSCDGDVWLENPLVSSYVPSLAIKAAEMQGRTKAATFSRKLREKLFLEKQNVADEKVLYEIARATGLDENSFQSDFHSTCAIKALQCDIKTTREMEVDRAPTFVFFNEKIEEAGLKVPGSYPYEVYVDILTEMLGFTPKRADKLPLEDFLKKFQFVASKEVAVVYDLSLKEAESCLKKLMLKRKVERVPVKYGTFWKYLSS